MGPLKGLKVLEMAGLGPGPFCSMMLGDMGADVIRIDRPNPSPLEGDASSDINRRSRRSVTLNLKTDAGCEAIPPGMTSTTWRSPARCTPSAPRTNPCRP
jgi:alpha-methylacyl-CoA racemase